MIARLIKRLSGEHGFTVTEMLVSIAVLGIFFAAFSTVVSSSITTSSQVQEEAVLQTEVRAAVDALAADLRQATNAGDTTLSRISTASSTQLTFLSPDRAQPMHLRRIAYQVTGGQLQRASATSTNTVVPWAIPALGAWSTVARSLVSASPAVFTYFDAAGAATAVAANVSTVRIHVAVATAAQPTRQLVSDTRVMLRPTS
jgi:prepilin-type N-terminal cleavage/methylation domain-containing protein